MGECIQKNSTIRKDAQKSDDVFKIVFDNSNDGITINEPGGRFLEVNQATCNALGYTREEMLQMTPYEITPARAAARYPEKIKELKQKGTVLFESIVVSKDGKHYPIELSMKIIEYQGKTAILSTIRDITERKKLEEKYHTLVEKGNDGIVIIQDGVLKFINSKTSEMTGYSTEEVIGEPFSRYVSENHRELILKRYKERLKNEKAIPSKDEIDIVSEDGNKIPVEMNVSLIEYESMPAIMAIIRDITERKLAENLLQESENRYRSLFQNNSAAILLIDPETSNIIDANPAACSYYGYTREEMIRQSLWDINTLKKEEIFEKINKAKMSNQNHLFLTHRMSNGELRDVEVHSYPILMNGKKILYAIISDITNFKNMENELLKAKVEAETANRAKSQFLANMSHELRTPLNAVIGFSDMLFGQNFGPLNEKQLKYASNISISGKHLLEVINEILDLSKIEAGKMELHIEEFYVFDVIDEVKKALVPFASNKNIDFVSEISKGLTTIKADKTKFKQILYNLIDNAIKFSPEEGCVALNAKLVGSNVQISVADTGIGIAKEEQTKLFQPFRQLIRFESKEQSGTGLGLSLVKRFVEMHGGSIWIESELNKGSTFTFTSPINGPN